MSNKKYYTKNEIEQMGYGIENNMIEEVDVNIIAHFGNIPCFTIMCKDIVPYGCYNDIARLGFLLKWFVKFFECDREDGRMLSEIKNIPCRLVFESDEQTHFGKKAVGIGHYMNNKFVLFEEFNEVIGWRKEN